MWHRLVIFIRNLVVAWLSQETLEEGFRLYDFETLSSHLKRADVILVEGRTRASGVVQAVTLSNWSHSALYVGRAGELPDRDLQKRVQQEHGWDRSEEHTSE